jgi:predicted carbohydrate-binding protein with CBM5 and CBM33 domain
MRISVIRTLAACVLLGFVSGAASHGLVQDSPSRDWFCWAITKPDQVANGTAKFPGCGNAFRARGTDFNADYSLMSVLTHHGRCERRR